MKLSELTELCVRATSTHWHAVASSEQWSVYAGDADGAWIESEHKIATCLSRDNAIFIAAAHAAMPALLIRIGRALERLEDPAMMAFEVNEILLGGLDV